MIDTGIKPKVLSEIKEIAKDHGIKNISCSVQGQEAIILSQPILDIAWCRERCSRLCFRYRGRDLYSLEYDIIDLEKPIADELRASIEREGKVIYEKI